MRIYDIIDKKRHAKELSKEEIEFVISSYMKDEIKDYQISALLMAICINSMSEAETSYLTNAILNSGDVLDLSSLNGYTVDKHSTGGIGDKTTLIVAPIVASLGCTVAKMSGRGLGFTGGTVDKLESIEGFKTELSPADFLSQAKDIGIVVVGQSADLAPADKKLYALRDVTATIDSIPLIASSIMSKKLASGSKSIVLDVKVGSGAFMKTVDDAEKLANAMVKLGKGFDRNVTAVLTNMNAPLGLAVGNSVELWEAMEVLSGRGEQNLKALCLTVSSCMVSSALSLELDVARDMVENAISTGKALAKFYEWIEYQGGNTSKIRDSSALLGAKYKKSILAEREGYISSLDAQAVGTASMMLGAGRIKKEDKIDHSAGIILNKRVGDFVTKSEPIAMMYTSNEALFDSASNLFLGGVSYSNKMPTQNPLIYKIIK
ncbi:MAG: thymidine phosphorylase [Clostridia bacterium]|nr:thymidine phosphorylase [Clostridia bacterium]